MAAPALTISVNMGGTAAAGAAAAPVESSDWIAALTFEIHADTVRFKDVDGPRLIKKVTARHPDGTPFWTQAFYRSSGRNSKFRGVWFPFLGISLKRGAPYFTKGLAYPASWPAHDIFHKKERISDADHELIGRFGTRSFLLAANALNALSEDAETRDEIASRIFEGVEPEPVDPVLQTLVSDNGAYDDATWKRMEDTLPESPPAEVNRFVGADIYVNYGKMDGRLNLSAGPMPNFFSLEGGRRRRSSRRRGPRERKCKGAKTARLRRRSRSVPSHKCSRV
jgi:hypothetical protein